ncbi:MAG: NAD(P)H-quinone oxidoreductase [Pseudomonadota bacterium]
MKAIVVEGEHLNWTEVADEACGVGQVRIRNVATAINRADLVQRAGGYPPPPGASPIMGLECAGEVIEVGEGVSRVAAGDRVCALLAGGGYAEEVVVPAGQVLPAPAGLDLVDAAALPEVFATAYLNLYMEAGLQPGEKVVLHAGASGVGTAAIQMLKASHNPCFVTAGNEEKIARCVALGADGGHCRYDGEFLPALRAWAGEAGVDVVLDPVGAQYLSDNLAALGLGGRLVLIGLMGGAQTQINLGALMMKRVRVIGSTLRARPIAEKAAVMQALQEHIWPAIAAGEIQPVIETRFAIEEAEAAHALVAGNNTVGKVLLTLA